VRSLKPKIKKRPGPRRMPSASEAGVLLLSLFPLFFFSVTTKGIDVIGHVRIETAEQHHPPPLLLLFSWEERGGRGEGERKGEGRFLPFPSGKSKGIAGNYSSFPFFPHKQKETLARRVVRHLGMVPDARALGVDSVSPPSSSLSPPVIPVRKLQRCR